MESIQNGNYDLGAERIKTVIRAVDSSAQRGQLLELAGTALACQGNHVHAGTLFVRAAEDLESVLESANDDKKKVLNERIHSLYSRAADEFDNENERTYQRRAEEARENADRFADS